MVAGKSPSSVYLLDPPTINTPSTLSLPLCGTVAPGIVFWVMILSYLSSHESPLRHLPRCPFLHIFTGVYTAPQKIAGQGSKDETDTGFVTKEAFE